MSAPRRVHRPKALRLSVDPIACEAYGYCAELLGEMVTLDEWGYPIVDGSPVPKHLVAVAKKAARDCPRRALLLSADLGREAETGRTRSGAAPEVFASRRPSGRTRRDRTLK